MPLSSQAPISSLIYRLATPITLAILLAAIWRGNAPYLHDFAEWLYQSRILILQVTRPEMVDGFQWAHYPVPNAIAIIILSGLGLAFSPILAGKIFLSLLLLAWVVVLNIFVKRIETPQNRPRLLGILFGLVALSNFFWTGFIGYQLGLLFLTLFLARYREKTRAREYLLFTIVLFFSHAMVFLVFVSLLITQIGIARNRLSHLPALAIAAILGLWFIIGRNISQFHPPMADAEMANWQEMVIYKFGFPLLLGPFKNLLGPDLSSMLNDMPWLYWGGVAANILVLAALATLCIKILLFPPRHPPYTLADDTPASVLRVTAFGLLGFYILAPYNFFGLINPAGRILLPLLLILLLLAHLWGQLSRVQPLLRSIAPISLLFSGVTSCSYLILMVNAPTPDKLPQAPVTQIAPPTGSVLAFNDWLYTNTSYRYFNYRIFSFSGRFEDMEVNRYQGLGFDTGLLIGYRAPK